MDEHDPEPIPRPDPDSKVEMILLAILALSVLVLIVLDVTGIWSLPPPSCLRMSLTEASQCLQDLNQT